MEKKVSVIIPVYNVEKYLGRCVDSILKQTFQEFELLLVDDGSTDNSGKIAKQFSEEYPDKIKYIYQPNNGSGAARNTGIQNAKCDIIVFIDSDDYIHEDMLFQMYNKMEEESLDIVICDYQRVDENDEITEIHREYLDEKECLVPNEEKQLLFADPSSCNKMFKKSLFVENDIYFPTKVWYAEDMRTIMKVIAVSNRIGYIATPFYNYFTRSDSKMNTDNIERQVEVIDAIDDLLTFFKVRNIYDQYYAELEYLTIQHVYVYAIARIARMDYKSGLIRQFKNYVKINFSNYKKNKYLNLLSKKERLFFKLTLYNLTWVISFLSKMKLFIRNVEKWLH